MQSTIEKNTRGTQERNQLHSEGLKGGVLCFAYTSSTASIADFRLPCNWKLETECCLSILCTSGIGCFSATHCSPWPPVYMYISSARTRLGAVSVAMVTHLLYCDGDMTWPSTCRLTFTVGFTLFTCLPAAAAAAAAAAVLFIWCIPPVPLPVPFGRRTLRLSTAREEQMGVGNTLSQSR